MKLIVSHQLCLNAVMFVLIVLTLFVLVELDDGVKGMRILAKTLTVISKKEKKGLPIPAVEYWLLVHPVSVANSIQYAYMYFIYITV